MFSFTETKHYLILLLIALLPIRSVCAEMPEPNTDSTHIILNSLPDNHLRLSFLDKKAQETMIGTAYFKYAQILYHEAKRQRNSAYEAKALFYYIRYYYSRDIDSMYYWMQKANPLFLKRQQYENYFRTNAWYIYFLSRKYDNETALRNITKLKEEAIQYNYPEGREMANQALANFYILNNLPKEGSDLYEEILHSMEERNAPLVKRINIIRQLINIHPQPQSRIEYLELLNTYIKDCERKNIKQLDSENKISFLQYIYHRNSAVEYLNTGEMDKALQHLDNATHISQTYQIPSATNSLRNIRASYYILQKKYPEALAIIDTLINIYKERKLTSGWTAAMQTKAEVLLKTGRDHEAAIAFQKFALLNDSISKITFHKELAQMRTRHDIDKLELKNQKMLLDATRSRMHVHLLLGGIVTLILIALLLSYMVYTVRRYGKEMTAAKERAEEADRLKSAFLANMNHEIRTPLNAIVGFSEILIEENDEEARKEYATIIRSNNDLLQRLICDVLDISKIESNMITFSYSQIELLEKMKQIYNVILLRMPDHVELLLEPCRELLLYTDKNRLTQILTNLLTNAIKHTRQGCIRFGYEMEGEYIRFYVTDTGDGIPEEQLEHIFSRFVKLNDWTQGVGLGLAISKGLITKMGGTISVQSKVGIGSTFSFTLPLHGTQP